MSQEIETLHKPFRKWLGDFGIAFTYHRPDQPTGATLGDADFILYNSNRVLMLEFKDKETRISKVQKDRHDDLARAGCIVHICRTLETATTITQQWLGALETPSAVPTLPTQKDASTGPIEGKEGPSDGWYGMDIHVSDAIPKDSCLVDHGNGKDFTLIKNMGNAAPVDGTAGDHGAHCLAEIAGMKTPVAKIAEDGQAFLDNIPHVSERIGEWQGQRWLIRKDKRGQEYFVRKATQNDLTRLAGKA